MREESGIRVARIFPRRHRISEEQSGLMVRALGKAPLPTADPSPQTNGY